jgi:hypothetical protein
MIPFKGYSYTAFVAELATSCSHRWSALDLGALVDSTMFIVKKV